MNRRARRRRLSSVVAIGFLLLVVAGHSSPRASYAATASAQVRSVPPGVIVFSHEDSGSTNPAQQYANLYRMDAQNATPSVRLTNFTQASTTAVHSILTKDDGQLAFVSNFSNAFPSLESFSTFAIGPDGSNLRPITGLGSIHALPKPPSGTVTGKVQAPQACDQYGNCLKDGQVNSCVISVQGAQQSVGCAADGSFSITDVPLASAWVRVLANVTYSETTAEPGTSLGWAALKFGANGTADAGTIEPVPQFPSSIEPAWSRDGGKVITTHYVSGKVLQFVVNPPIPPYYQWVPSQHNELWIWTSDGKSSQLVPNQPKPEEFGSDWSPIGPDRICFATGSARGEVDSAIYLANPDGSNQSVLYHVPFPSVILSLARLCRWSPDGQRVAFTQINENAQGGWWEDLFLINRDGTGLLQLTHNPIGSFSERPTWSPDGREIAFEIDKNSGTTPVPPAQSVDLFAIDP
ncbi:MAG: hypothetical protein E6I99_13745, partial [Chloroflexi bacterium]